jgi:shikimate kinase
VSFLTECRVELATTLARCGGTEHTRPVLADQANPAKRYEGRLPLYRTAHVTVQAGALTPDQVADAIAEAAGLSHHIR